MKQGTITSFIVLYIGLSTTRLKLSFYPSHKHLTAHFDFQGVLPNQNNRP